MKPLSKTATLTATAMMAGAMMAGAWLAWAGSSAASEVSRALVERARTDWAVATPEALARARDRLEQAIVLDPADAVAFRALGRTNELAGREARAQAHYLRSLDMEPDDTQTLEWAGQLDLREGRLDSAQERLERLRLRCGDCVQSRSFADALTMARRKLARDTDNTDAKNKAPSQ